MGIVICIVCIIIGFVAERVQMSRDPEKVKMILWGIGITALILLQMYSCVSG